MNNEYFERAKEILDNIMADTESFASLSTEEQNDILNELIDLTYKLKDSDNVNFGIAFQLPGFSKPVGLFDSLNFLSRNEVLELLRKAFTNENLKVKTIDDDFLNVITEKLEKGEALSDDEIKFLEFMKERMIDEEFEKDMSNMDSFNRNITLSQYLSLASFLDLGDKFNNDLNKDEKVLFDPLVFNNNAFLCQLVLGLLDEKSNIYSIFSKHGLERVIEMSNEIATDIMEYVTNYGREHNADPAIVALSMLTITNSLLTFSHLNKLDKTYDVNNLKKIFGKMTSIFSVSLHETTINDDEIKEIINDIKPKSELKDSDNKWANAHKSDKKVDKKVVNIKDFLLDDDD